MEEKNNKDLTVLIYVFLAIATFVVYIQVVGHEFVSFDDNSYIYDNPYVKQGLTEESIQ